MNAPNLARPRKDRSGKRSGAARYRQAQEKYTRHITTPEGVALTMRVAMMGSRFGAFILDMLLLMLVMAGFIAAIIFILWQLDMSGSSELLEALAVTYFCVMFLLRYGYFMAFELGPRGATLGKRALGIRVAAHDGGRLTASAVLARNLLRDIELFLPIAMLFSDILGGAAAGAAFIWLAIFVLFPFFNRDRMRAGDVIAGTWVVDTPKAQLGDTLASAEAASGQSALTGREAYRFSDKELSVYGEYELQRLEEVLRSNDAQTMAQVQKTICTKLGWNSGSGDERAFLEAYYAQLRAKLEGDMRFGKRKADKFDAEA